MWVHVGVYVGTCRCVCVCTCRCVSGYMWVCVWVHVGVYVGTCRCVCGYMWVCMWVHVGVCGGTCGCVCGYMWVCGDGFRLGAYVCLFDSLSKAVSHNKVIITLPLMNILLSTSTWRCLYGERAHKCMDIHFI